MLWARILPAFWVLMQKKRLINSFITTFGFPKAPANSFFPTGNTWIAQAKRQHEDMWNLGSSTELSVPTGVLYAVLTAILHAAVLGWLQPMSYTIKTCDLLCRALLKTNKMSSFDWYITGTCSVVTPMSSSI